MNALTGLLAVYGEIGFGKYWKFPLIGNGSCSFQLKQITMDSRFSTSENKSKNTWKLVNPLRPSKKTYNDFVRTARSWGVPGLSQLFCFCVPKLISSLSPLNKMQTQTVYKSNSSSLYLCSSKGSEALLACKQLKSKSSCGYDGISSPSWLWKSVDDLIEPLTFIVHSSFAYGIFSSSLKLSTAKPIIKTIQVNFVIIDLHVCFHLSQSCLKL